jgi:hypothetical protein
MTRKIEPIVIGDVQETTYDDLLKWWTLVVCAGYGVRPDQLEPVRPDPIALEGKDLLCLPFHPEPK